MTKGATIFAYGFIVVSTILMVALPLVLFYAFWGVVGLAVGVMVAVIFWVIMGITYVRARRLRLGRSDSTEAA